LRRKESLSLPATPLLLLKLSVALVSLELGAEKRVDKVALIDMLTRVADSILPIRIL
jgi:hypothetical protein